VGVQTRVPAQAHYAGIIHQTRQQTLYMASRTFTPGAQFELLHNCETPCRLQIAWTPLARATDCIQLAMSTRRLNTVHDLASLRLHPDGTRIQNNNKNLRIRGAKYAARDSKGNWFARDAGGIGRVKQRWAKARDEDAKEDSSTGTDEDENPLPTAAKGKGKGKPRASEADVEEPPKDERARKRRRFHEDESFIAPTPSGGPSAQGSPKASSSRLSESEPLADWALPTPSAETLKCMHYFACNYYTAMGQLRDSTKGARRSKKARRKQRLQEEEDGARSSEPADEPAHDSSTEGESSSTSDSESSEDEDEDDNNYKPQMRSRRRRRASPDMYKALDGSALMAISMLVQEHITHLLSADVPDEWDEEMEADKQAQRGKQAALISILDSQHGRPSWKLRSRNTKEVEGDEEEEQLEQDKDAETPGRRTTRGVVLPKVTVPFADNSSEDDDYVP